MFVLASYSLYGSILMLPAKVICVVEVEKSKDTHLPYIEQLLVPDFKFPLPHCVTMAY
jgi:hypothetical protein